MGFDSDTVQVYVDQWGLRRLFSLAVSRRGAPRKARDPAVEQFFDVLVKHWGKPKPKNKKGKPALPEPLDECADVDPALLSDTEEGDEVILKKAVTDAYMLDAAEMDGLGSQEEKTDADHAHAAAEDPACDVDLDLEEQLIWDELARLKCLSCLPCLI